MPTPDARFAPGDPVLIDNRLGDGPRQAGVVTYPGRNGIPGRIYVRHDGITTHHHPEDLTHQEA